MLNGPVMSSARATSAAICFTLRMVAIKGSAAAARASRRRCEPGILDVLADRPQHERALVGDRIDLDFTRVSLEFRHHHGVLPDTSCARSRIRSSSFLSWATLMAAPLST